VHNRWAFTHRNQSSAGFSEELKPKLADGAVRSAISDLRDRLDGCQNQLRKLICGGAIGAKPQHYVIREVGKWGCRSKHGKVKNMEGVLVPAKFVCFQQSSYFRVLVYKRLGIPSLAHRSHTITTYSQFPIPNSYLLQSKHSDTSSINA